MTDRPCPVGRRAFALGLVFTFALAACAPPQRIYRTDPVARDGSALAVESAVQLVFEDRQTRSLRGEEKLSLVDGRFVLENVRRADGTRGTLEWDASQVEGLELVDARGKRRWADVKTPDDLLDFQRLPRIARIEMRDGRVVQIQGQNREARWSADGLSLRVGPRGGDLDAAESLPLDEVYSVTLHEPDLMGATLRSPMFWVAGAAAAGLFIWVNQGADENDAVR